MTKKSLCAMLAVVGFTLLQFQVAAQTPARKYFVKFKHKNQSTYQLSNPSQFLGAGAVWRRNYYQLPYDSTDLPVNASYITQLDAINNVTLLYVTKWLNGAVVSIPNTATVAALADINALPFVASSAQINPRLRLSRMADAIPVTPEQLTAMRSANSGTYNMGGALAQNQQIQVDCLHNAGYRGQGMVIAVMDVGFNNVNVNPVFDSLNQRGGILGTRDFVSGGNSVYEDGAHGAHVLSCLAAVKPGTIIGTAPMANYWLLRTEDIGSETIVEEYNWVRAAEFADSVGADILTTSLGYTTFDNASQNHSYATLNGKTAPMSIAANLAARKGMFVLNAAGNEGGGAWNYISVPSDADSVCAVGAVDANGTVGSFSGVGPTADGRIKPDLLARGVGAWIAGTNGDCFFANGTSFACPILAGGVACAWQRNRGQKNTELLAILKGTANNFATPNNSKGWGIANVCAASVGIGEIEREGSLTVFPNPFRSVLELKLSDPAESLFGVQILDVLGHVVLEQKNLNGAMELTLPAQGLADGLYVVRATTAKGTVTRKIVKQ